MDEKSNIIRKFWLLLGKKNSEDIRKLLITIKNDEFFLDATKGIKRQQVLDIYSKRYGLKNPAISSNKDSLNSIFEKIQKSSSDLIVVISITTREASHIFFLDSNISSIIGIIKTKDLNIDKVKELIREWEKKSIPNSYVYYSSISI